MTQPDLRIDFTSLVPKFDAILARGLCSGVGKRDGQMCIEAAICAALDLPHGDDPECVSRAVRSFKISLNDASWSSPTARANGLRALGIAQIGSRDVVDDGQFVSRLTEKIIKELIPSVFRRVALLQEEPHKAAMLKAADKCELTGSQKSAEEAQAAAWAAAAWAAWAAAARAAARAAEAAARAAARAAEAAAEAAARADKTTDPDPDFYLRLVAKMALDVLIDLKSPGALWLLDQENAR